MRVMLTGGTGFIGGHILRALVEAGHEPVALVRSAAKLEQVCTIHGISEPVAHVVGDILDPASVAEAIEGADACVHAAAFTTLDPAEMPKALEINAPGARNVLGAAVAAGCDPVVHMSSSSCIFPTVGDLADPNVDPVHSSDAPYPKSKADSELYARQLQDEGHPVTILYPAGACGPDEVGMSVISMMLAGMLAEDYLMAAESGGWSILDVRDFARAAVGVLQPGKGARRYMAGGHMVSWEEFNRLAAEITGKERITHLMTRAELLENLDEEAVEIMLGIKPGNDAPLLADSGVGRWRPLEETLGDTLRWLLDTGSLAPEAAPAL